MLQPAWLKAGITSRRKLTGAGSLHPLDLDRRLRLDAPPPGHDRRRAVAPGDRPAPWRRPTATSGSRLTQSRTPGQVADRAVGVRPRDDELPRGSLARERWVLRPDASPGPELRSEPQPCRHWRSSSPSKRGRVRREQEQTRDQTASLAVDGINRSSSRRSASQSRVTTAIVK